MLIDDDPQNINLLKTFPTQPGLPISIIHEYLNKNQCLKMGISFTRLCHQNEQYAPAYYKELLEAHFIPDAKAEIAHLRKHIHALAHSFSFFKNSLKCEVYQDLLNKIFINAAENSGSPQRLLSKAITQWEEKLLAKDEELTAVTARRILIKPKDALTRSEELLESLIEAVFPAAKGNKRTTIMHHLINHITSTQHEDEKNSLKTLLSQLQKLPLESSMATYRNRISLEKSKFQSYPSSYARLETLEKNLAEPSPTIALSQSLRT